MTTTPPLDAPTLLALENYLEGRIAAIVNCNPVEITLQAAEDIKAALSQCADDKEREAWQPIETAPKDGTHFLTWDSFYGIRKGRHYARSDHDDWLSYLDAFGNSHKGGMRATHWRPLPAPPASEGEG
jgi:hypothetical protein